jgi:UDP-N-acetylglucosamine--N-acetylmuramyl-(pentapeptide) pyrophosphoryl-undecaprenol N-acetylglucosamine transferase
MVINNESKIPILQKPSSDNIIYDIEMILLFFTSPIGLGHATRDIAIAEKLTRLIRKEDILFISGDSAFTLISKLGYPVFDFYKVEKFHIKAGQLHQPFKWLMKYLLYYKRCKIIAANVLKKYDNLIVSDEDFASIAIGEKMNRKRIIITDITETHFTSGLASIFERKMSKTMRKMIDKCDYVIIPDFGDDKDNIVHVGPIVREVSATKDALRKKLGFDKRTIVVSVGGTDAGKYLIEKSLEAYKKFGKRTETDLVIVSGPSIKLADCADFHNAGFVSNLHEYIYASDLVISLAGKSTIDEAIAYGIPGIFIPIKNHFEQEERANRLGYKYEDIFRLHTLIEEKLSLHSDVVVNANGAEKAAKLISKLF